MELTASSFFVFFMLPLGLLSVRDQRSSQVASSRALVVPPSSRAGSHRPRPPPFVLLRPPSRTRLTQWRFWRSRGTRRSSGGDCRRVGRACELGLLFVRFSGSRECVFCPTPLPFTSSSLPFSTPLRGSDHPHSSILVFPLVLCAGPKTTEAILLPLLGSMMVLAAPSNVLSREQIRWAVLYQTVGMFRFVFSDRFSPRKRVSFEGRADAF